MPPGKSLNVPLEPPAREARISTMRRARPGRPGAPSRARRDLAGSARSRGPVCGRPPRPAPRAVRTHVDPSSSTDAPPPPSPAALVPVTGAQVGGGGLGTPRRGCALSPGRAARGGASELRPPGLGRGPGRDGTGTGEGSAAAAPAPHGPAWLAPLRPEWLLGPPAPGPPRLGCALRC